MGLPEKAIEELRFTDINATGKIGFIVDYATDLELHHVRVTAAAGSALSIENSSNLVLDDVSPRTAKATTPALAVLNSSDLILRNSRAAAATDTFLHVAGAKTAGVILSANDLSRAKSDVVLADGASAQAVSRK